MKHLLPITLVVAALLATTSSQAQQQQPARLAKKLFGQEAPHPTTQRSAARGSRSLRATTASSPGRAIIHYWDEENRRWTNGQITSYTYNAQGLVTQEVYTDSATNQINGRYQTTYNSRGDETENLSQGWDGTAYVNLSRSQTTYDAQGNETLYTYQQWADGAWQTGGSYRTTNTYSPAGLLIGQVFEELDPEANTWQPDGRQTYTFNSANQWTGLLFEEWDSELKKYVNDERINNITWANWEELRPASYEEQEWDAVSGTWQSDQRTTITYQPNGSSLEIRQVMTAPNVWTNERRYVNNYDDYGNETLDQVDEWVNSGWQILDSRRYLLSYTATNQLRREVAQEYNTEEERYENRYVATYSNFVALATRRATGLEAAASLYPNPTQGRFTFSVPGLRAQGPAKATITNALGQVVRTLTLPVQQGSISQDVELSRLPAGVYTLQLQTSEGMVAKRVVKQ